jgi:hypothetical protein
MVFEVWLPIVYAMDIFWVAHSEIVTEFLIMDLLQFDYLYYEIGPVVDASLNWMDSPAFDDLESKKIGLVQSQNYTCVD